MHQSSFSSLLTQLGEMPSFLQQSLAGMPKDILVRQPSEDKSPLIEHLWHIRDCDFELYGLRIRRVLREETPTLEPVDVDVWVETRSYPLRNGDQAIDEFRAYRVNLIAELAILTSDQLARTGIRADMSEINILGIIEQLAAHDRDHRWRIARILRIYLLGSSDA
jgi:DinB superfamily